MVKIAGVVLDVVVLIGAVVVVRRVVVTVVRRVVVIVGIVGTFVVSTGEPEQ